MSIKVAPVPVEQDSSISKYDRVVLDKKTRMLINGETETQMEHVMKMKLTRPDTTVDDKWEIDQSLASVDALLLNYTKFYLIIKLFLLFIPIFILMFPYVLVTKLYTLSMKTPTDEVIRTTPGFIIYSIFASVSIMLPSLFIIMGRCMDGFMYYLFSIPYCCFSKNGWERRRKGLNAIAPYSNGPTIKIVDVFVCSIGQMLRNGVIEHTLCLTVMFTVIPWIKYFINCNPYVYDLSERFVQQITTSMDDLGIENVKENGKRIISRCVQEQGLQKRLDLWNFCPHYPYRK